MRIYLMGGDGAANVIKKYDAIKCYDYYRGWKIKYS